MAVIEMQKVAIIAHNSIKEQLIDTLHKEGVVELTETKAQLAIDHTDVNFRAAELKFSINVLKEHASKETLTVARKATNEQEIVHAARHTDVRCIIDDLHDLEEADTEAERLKKESLKLQEILEPWTALPYSLALTLESQTTIRILGFISTIKLEELKSELKEKNVRTDIAVVGTLKSASAVVVHVLKEDRNRFEETAVTLGWTNVELPALDGLATELIEKAQMQVKKSENLQHKNRENRKNLSVELPNLVKVQRYMNWLDDKQTAREAMSETETTLTLLGWMPKNRLSDLERKLQDNLGAVAVLKVKPDENEEAPVLLRNPLAIAPFESVTNLYGNPLYSEMDPTMSLAPFFALYFALCLTDAGYGAVLAAIFGFVIWKKKLKVRDSKLVWTLFFGGIVTFFVSIPFGGWFGFAPAQVPAFLTRTTSSGEVLFLGQIWNLSTESGITFLQNLSLVLGLTHLFYGMFLAGYHKWIHGKKVEALWMDFTSHLLLGAAILYALQPTTYKLYLLYTVIAIFIWGKGYGSKWFLRPIMGAIGLLNFCIGLLSNTLSYLRILALGLVTGAIAMAVNQVAVEVGKLFPIWIAVPVVIGIFVMGHLISIALNTLGSFIHSGRLQFIEFFSQFFEGGGRSFSPFKRSTI
ncbi:hypothetical protein KKC44_01400 [Patescibacteria group bacterium]|nr:hypothetical protein [Patescibacteria group bacterium]MBU2259238.1 hypothetical protein [Patescibacteria group bacterium]